MDGPAFIEDEKEEYYISGIRLSKKDFETVINTLNNEKEALPEEEKEGQEEDTINMMLGTIIKNVLSIASKTEATVYAWLYIGVI